MPEPPSLVFNSERLHTHDSTPLGDPVDFDVKGLGRRLPRREAPEGWIKKVERCRQGRVWIGFFHVWMTDVNGRRVRQKKEKTLGPASMPKHEAQKKLAKYIEEYTGRIRKQGNAITTFADLWNAYCAVRSGQWAKKTKEDLQYLFAKHVIPVVGSQPPGEVTPTSLQLLLNKMAEDGYRKSTVEKVRTHTKACFDYAMDEDLIEKNPARKLLMPNIRKKSCERFLSVDELRALLSQAAPREHLVLRILAVCGLRPAEALVLRIEDFAGGQLRIDEALKERERGEDRIGTTKTAESDNYVPVPPDLEREIASWIAGHPDRNNPRAFLFPNSTGGAYRVGNYLKRHLKTLAEKVGIQDLTHQAFRRTSSTLMQNHANVKDMQRHLRHTNPNTTLRHYTKFIPESLRAAVAALDAQITGDPTDSE
ncbi:MAG: site-specific integrase [Acidobacteriaceae bacterium]|nr:site-specific integrase [Acidobacteriaceae bacterium]